jgi:hypothetical protein
MSKYRDAILSLLRQEGEIDSRQLRESVRKMVVRLSGNFCISVYSKTKAKMVAKGVIKRRRKNGGGNNWIYYL